MNLSDSRGPLSDLSVLDLSRGLPGSYCARALAAYGAEVVYVEAPRTGNLLRRAAPFYKDLPHHNRGALHNHVNLGKRGITLDVESGVGGRVLRELAMNSDILVEDHPVGTLETKRLGYETLSGINPGMVMTSLSNFGRKGPYRDYKASELILSGLSGPLYINGALDREPAKAGGRIVQFQAGMVAAMLTMMAARSRDRSGIGSHVDLSTMETQAGTADRWVPVLAFYSYTGSIAERTRGVVLAGAGVVPTEDGYVNTLNPTNPSRFKKILNMVGKPELMDAPEFGDPLERLAMVNEEFLLWSLQHSTAEAVEAGLRHGVMIAPVHTHETLHHDAHMLVRRPWVQVEHPEMGEQAFPVRPAQLSRTPMQVSRPAPRLGEHNREVYCGELGYSRADLARLGRVGVV